MTDLAPATGAPAHPPVTVATNSGVTPPPELSARSRTTERVIGTLALVGTACTVWLGLWVPPPARTQGDLVRLVYVHPGVAWVALYLAFGLAAVWWAWDARLTLTAVLLVLFLGYLALRRIPAEPEVRARRSAFVALFAVLDVPLVHFSVNWWNTLHQGATVLNPGLTLKIHGSMAWTLLLGFVALTLAFVWMLLVRYRIGVLEDWLDANELDAALAERQAEGAESDDGTGMGGEPGDGAPTERVGVA